MTPVVTWGNLGDLKDFLDPSGGRGIEASCNVWQLWLAVVLSPGVWQSVVLAFAVALSTDLFVVSTHGLQYLLIWGAGGLSACSNVMIFSAAKVP